MARGDVCVRFGIFPKRSNVPIILYPEIEIIVETALMPPKIGIS